MQVKYSQQLIRIVFAPIPYSVRNKEGGINRSSHTCFQQQILDPVTPIFNT